jgi:hypothetical protein
MLALTSRVARVPQNREEWQRCGVGWGVAQDQQRGVHCAGRAAAVIVGRGVGKRDGGAKCAQTNAAEDAGGGGGGVGGGREEPALVVLGKEGLVVAGESKVCHKSLTKVVARVDTRNTKETRVRRGAPGVACSIVACDLCVVEVSVLIRACQVTCRRGDPVADTLYHQRGQRVHRYANTICNCDYEDARNEGRQGYTTWALVADSYGSALRYRRANRLDCPVVVLYRYLAHCINSIYYTASFISQLYLRRNLIEIGFRISTIIISPTPLLAATFMIFSHVVQQLGTGYSWLSP